MNWTRTKSIFIVTFFCLNVFLAWQLMDKVGRSQIGVFDPDNIETRLKENNIKVADVPEEIGNMRESGSVLKGTWEPFTEDDVKSLVAQKANRIADNWWIESTFDSPIDITSDEENGYTAFLSTYIYKGLSYTFSSKDEDSIYFDQKFKQQRTVVPEGAPLELYLNDNNQVTGYVQRYYDFDITVGGRDALKYLQALEVLLDKQHLRRNDHVTHIELSYYQMRTERFSETEYFIPAWTVEIERESGGKKRNETYLVDAISGVVYQWPLESTIGGELEQVEEGKINPFDRVDEYREGGNR
ncbi:two-component system regulatory protein YycI [Shouchella lonarensis]|uniref:Two-component signal transduction system YycFG, regulatory protein YycI n=1 Tax=Shouchella lonarensis TaxID=1464122 RepID=A0A1G6LWD9_9BACI|nr:two-component system regulatory protein YycI [Shouchella lonarensis]SDC47529.1 Two-component signal transduction system YycFG, regulatory protein YycI [Shouchella lonarensis]